MHLRTTLLIASWAACALSFPAQQFEHLAKRDGILEGLLDASSDLVQSIATDLREALTALDHLDSSGPVDVTGEHAFQAPSVTDQRGPCPGLNALANHGYINRDGIASLIDVVPAIVQVYGMGVELALVLAVMGVVWTGDPISLDPSFSIGSNDTAVENALDNLQGMLGTPQGIDYSHNFIEADSSPTRNDLYVTGNAWSMNISRFQELYDTVPESETFTFDSMSSWAAKRWHDSVETNPYFYYGPFTGMIARNAGYLFYHRLFANHSSSEGVLTHDILKNFFGVYGESGNLTYKEGHEQIPSNWYHIPSAYGIVELNVDTVAMVLQHPELGSIGGNIGTVNSYTGVDLDDVLGGTLDASQLLESNNLVCFALEVVKFATPNYLSNVYSTLSAPLDLVTGVLETPLTSLACPVWKDLTNGGESLLTVLETKYPGANKSSRAL